MSVAEMPGTMLAPAKLNLCLYVGPRAGGRPARDPLAVRAARARRRARSSARPRGRGDRRGNRGAGSDREGAGGPARERLGRTAAADRGDEAGPGGGGSRRRERRRRRGAAAGARARWRDCDRSRPSIGADVPSQLQPRACLVAGAGEVIEPAPPPAEHGVVLIPQAEGLATADVYAEADRLGHAAGRVRARGDPARGSATPWTRAVRRSTSASIWSTTCSRRRSRCAPRSRMRCDALEEAGAAHAMVTGSGPTAFGLFPTRGRGGCRGRESAREVPGAPIATAPRRMSGIPISWKWIRRGLLVALRRRLLRLPRRPAAHRPRADDRGPLRGAGGVDLPAGRRARLPGDRCVRRTDRPRGVHRDARRRGRAAG